jgi:hypothetical protein
LRAVSVWAGEVRVEVGVGVDDVEVRASVNELVATYVLYSTPATNIIHEKS